MSSKAPVIVTTPTGRQVREGDEVTLEELGLTPDGCAAFDVRHGTRMTVVDGLKGVKGKKTRVKVTRRSHRP